MTDQTTFRVRAILTEAVASLDPADLNERIAWCREHNQHGVRMHTNADDDLLEFRWGGRTLAMVHRDVLTGDGPIRAEFIAETPVPDTVPDAWTDDTH